MQNRKLNLVLGGIGLIAIGAAIAFFPKDQWQRWLLRREIARLSRSEFETQRNAQNRIIQRGVAALPELLAALDTAEDEKQKALVCYLIGAIDPMSYKQVLLSSNSTQNVCIVSRYLNKDAIRSLQREECESIIQHYRRLSSTLNEEHRKCAESIIQFVGESANVPLIK
jgi:hypothetical protein